jgi:hypothetical protein
MFSRSSKGRKAPPDLSLAPRQPDAVSLHDRKLAAWGLAVGASVPLAYPARDRRPHRGELADIDMNLAGPDPGRRSLLRRVLGWLGRLRPGPGAKADAAMSGTDPDAIGAASQMPYTGGKPVA